MDDMSSFDRFIPEKPKTTSTYTEAPGMISGLIDFASCSITATEIKDTSFLFGGPINVGLPEWQKDHAGFMIGGPCHGTWLSCQGSYFRYQDKDGRDHFYELKFFDAASPRGVWKHTDHASGIDAIMRSLYSIAIAKHEELTMKETP